MGSGYRALGGAEETARSGKRERKREDESQAANLVINKALLSKKNVG